ncbi:MAG TPA: phosphoribosyltransferase family protein [Longimicrobium sp.]|jgi:hypoxanthine phosphoribosyltransferase|nr:phosphoribosyltransferase family protein [Longimicrobium sp.]
MVQPIPFPRTGDDGGGGASDTLELSWELFGELCRALAIRVAHEYDPDLVIGIATAGVIPAATVAGILQVEFESMKISRRDGTASTRPSPAVLSSAPPRARGRRVLIVDELTTSGDTLRLALAAVREVGPAEVRTATSFVRPGGYRPDYFALETPALIVFPWDRQVIERGELVTPPIYTGPILHA